MQLFPRDGLCDQLKFRVRVGVTVRFRFRVRFRVRDRVRVTISRIYWSCAVSPSTSTSPRRGCRGTWRVGMRVREVYGYSEGGVW